MDKPQSSQLDLRFELDRTIRLTPRERQQVLEALAALLRTAAMVVAKPEVSDEGR